MIIIQYIVEHGFCLYCRTVGVELNGLYIAVDGFLPVALLTVVVALLV